MPATGAVRWTVLVPVKALPRAKSRLAGFSPDADAHANLVRQDVDTESDLHAAVLLGVGPSTLAAIATRSPVVHPDRAS
jgi:2-phospho-L-lactate guanylyltransferase (CobY/MobA/RfbA family)